MSVEQRDGGAVELKIAKRFDGKYLLQSNIVDFKFYRNSVTHLAELMKQLYSSRTFLSIDEPFYNTVLSMPYDKEKK